MDKYEVASIFNNIGKLLELKGESFFKSRAYYDAARTIGLLDEDLKTLVKEDRIKAIKGFGDALSAKLKELFETGRLEYYEKLKESFPSGVGEMLRIPGLGQKKIMVLYERLGINTVDELKKACLENRLAELPGFGEKTQQKILEGIDSMDQYSGSFLFPFAMNLGTELLNSFKQNPNVIRSSFAGSIRRKKEIVKDIDLLVSSDDSSAIMELFTTHPLVAQVTSKGDTKSSVILNGGINADLRVVSDIEYPYALHHFTGSKEHNTALRHIARQKSIKVNEYGLFRDEKLMECTSEEDIFKALGMTFIPPELREDNGELEAAKKGELPLLIKGEDIKGVLHVHSHYSDGTNSVEELVKYCIEKGYTYLGISDHSQTAYYAGGLKKDDIKRQHEEIDRLNLKYPDFLVLKGIELDILPDGSLDYDEDILTWFDFRIASVHSVFKMDEDKMTERVIKAIKNRFVNILGHPSGRVLLRREPFKINMNQIITAASDEKVILEINASPHRLDLDWRYCKGAKEAGCRFAVNPDAHALSEIDDMEYGINVARKGWLTKEDIVNTMSAHDIKNLFGEKTK